MSEDAILERLIDLDDVAEIWKCSRRHARDVLTKLPDFPPPARGSTMRHPVWLRSRVLAFAAGELVT